MDLLYDLGDFEVVVCRQCGLQYVNEKMASVEIETLYDTDDFHRDHFSFYFPGIEDRVIDDYLEDVRRVRSRIPDRPRILDVGCADGRFLSRLSERFEKCGVDISRPAVEKGVAQFGLNLVCGDVLDKATDDLFQKSTFDLITLWMILEHLPDPRGMIERLARLLKRGGLVMIRVPNADGLLNLFAHILYRTTLGCFRKPLTYFYTRLHIYNFGVKPLTRLLEVCGFEVIDVFYDDRYVTKHVLPYMSWWAAAPLWVAKMTSRLLDRRDSFTLCAVLR